MTGAALHATGAVVVMAVLWFGILLVISRVDDWTREETDTNSSHANDADSWR